MKKTLLLAALAATFASANAEGFSDMFAVTCDGVTYTDGQTITVRNYWDPIVKDNPEFAGLFPSEYYNEADVHATNLSDEPKELQFSLKVVTPSAEEFNSNAALGNLQLCYDYETAAGQCKEVKNGFLDFTEIEPVSAEEYIGMKVEQSGFTDLSPVTLQLDLRVMDDGNEESVATFFINFTHEADVTNAVEGVEADSESVYFTLQGIPTAAPQKGHIYIERKSGKVVKRLF